MELEAELLMLTASDEFHSTTMVVETKPNAGAKKKFPNKSKKGLANEGVFKKKACRAK